MWDSSGPYMFFIDIPFKGCQGRSNRSSIVHAVSYFACGLRTDVLMKKKTEVRKSRDTVPLINS
jgi:hypothetical protein